MSGVLTENGKNPLEIGLKKDNFTEDMYVEFLDSLDALDKKNYHNVDD